MKIKHLLHTPVCNTGNPLQWKIESVKSGLIVGDPPDQLVLICGDCGVFYAVEKHPTSVCANKLVQALETTKQ